MRLTPASARTSSRRGPRTAAGLPSAAKPVRGSSAARRAGTDGFWSLGPNRVSGTHSGRTRQLSRRQLSELVTDGTLIAFTDLPWKLRPAVALGDGGRRLRPTDARRAGGRSALVPGRSLDRLRHSPRTAGGAHGRHDHRSRRHRTAFAGRGGLEPGVVPDGATIAFERSAGIYAISIDGSGERLLLAGARGAAWSPDGARIAFVRGGGRPVSGRRRLQCPSAHEDTGAGVRPGVAAGAGRGHRPSVGPAKPGLLDPSSAVASAMSAAGLTKRGQDAGSPRAGRPLHPRRAARRRRSCGRTS